MSILANEFNELEPFLENWARATENERSQRRWVSNPNEYQAFYDAMIVRLDEVLNYLDKFTLGKMPEDTEKLYHLTLAFAEAAPHVELYKGSSDVPHSFDPERFVAAHGDIAD